MQILQAISIKQYKKSYFRDKKLTFLGIFFIFFFEKLLTNQLQYDNIIIRGAKKPYNSIIRELVMELQRVLDVLNDCIVAVDNLPKTEKTTAYKIKLMGYEQNCVKHSADIANWDNSKFESLKDYCKKVIKDVSN